jgi:hypothetical protein
MLCSSVMTLWLRITPCVVGILSSAGCARDHERERAIDPVSEVDASSPGADGDDAEDDGSALDAPPDAGQPIDAGAWADAGSERDAGPVNDPGVAFSIDNLDARVREGGDGVLEFPYGSAGEAAEPRLMVVLATFNEAADATEYGVTVEPSDGAWRVEYGPAGPRPGKSVGQVQLITAFVTLDQEAPADGQAHPAKLTFTATRHVGQESFTSFVTYDVRGY